MSIFGPELPEDNPPLYSVKYTPANQWGKPWQQQANCHSTPRHLKCTCTGDSQEPCELCIITGRAKRQYNGLADCSCIVCMHEQRYKAKQAVESAFKDVTPTKPTKPTKPTSITESHERTPEQQADWEQYGAGICADDEWPPLTPTKIVFLLCVILAFTMSMLAVHLNVENHKLRKQLEEQSHVQP